MIAALRATALIVVCTMITARGVGAQVGGGDSRGTPFERGAWMLTLSGSALAEAWNYNTSREELYLVSGGLRHGVSSRIVLAVEAVTGYVSQRGADSFLMAWLGGLRWRTVGRGRLTLSIDLDVGMAHSELRVPPRATRFNYLFRPGLTAVWPVKGGTCATVGITWLHLSNNSLEGRGHNPDIQAVGLTAGVLVPF